MYDEFLPAEYFEDIKTKLSYNLQISNCYTNFAEVVLSSSDVYLESEKSYYFDDPDFCAGLANEYEELDLFNRLHKKRDRLDHCMGSWVSDYYRFSSVKNVKRVVLCKDKFCYNCQSMLAQKRYQKYMPVLISLSQSYDLYHVVFTVPNPSFTLLLGTVKQMYKVFPYLIRYLNGTKFISNIDFLRYNFQGALRSLEVTLGSDRKTFHPHFHCIFAFNKGTKFDGSTLNEYSFDSMHDKDVHAFNDFEILLQKVWYFLMNGITVTRANIDDCKLGYDVLSMPAKGHEHECFKYATKGVFKEGVFNAGSYDADLIFQTLFPVMDNRRVIQGYGCFRGFSDLEGALLEEDFTAWYTDKINQLEMIEKSYEVNESFAQVYDCSKSVHYMSKFNLKRLFLIEREVLDRDLIDLSCEVYKNDCCVNCINSDKYDCEHCIHDCELNDNF